MIKIVRPFVYFLVDDFYFLRQALASDGKPTPLKSSMPFYKIGRREVADLLVASMMSKDAAGATLSCSWGKDPNG